MATKLHDLDACASIADADDLAGGASSQKSAWLIHGQGVDAARCLAALALPQRNLSRSSATSLQCQPVTCPRVLNCLWSSCALCNNVQHVSAWMRSHAACRDLRTVNLQLAVTLVRAFHDSTPCSLYVGHTHYRKDVMADRQGTLQSRSRKECKCMRLRRIAPTKHCPFKSTIWLFERLVLWTFLQQLQMLQPSNIVDLNT